MKSDQAVPQKEMAMPAKHPSVTLWKKSHQEIARYRYRRPCIALRLYKLPNILWGKPILSICGAQSCFDICPMRLKLEDVVRGEAE